MQRIDDRCECIQDTDQELVVSVFFLQFSYSPVESSHIMIAQVLLVGSPAVVIDSSHFLLDSVRIIQ